MKSHGLEIRDHLRPVDWGEGLNSFQLDKQFLCYQKVDPPLTNIPLFVADWNRPLPFERDPPKRQFDHQGFFIDAF